MGEDEVIGLVFMLKDKVGVDRRIKAIIIRR